jgi:hypothetical protein
MFGGGTLAEHRIFAMSCLISAFKCLRLTMTEDQIPVARDQSNEDEEQTSARHKEIRVQEKGVRIIPSEVCKPVEAHVDSGVE